MADSDSPATPTGLALPRACDSCRSRKIRCDKIAPCSNCRTANIKCHTSDRPAKEQRQRVLISNQYEQKIDAIEDRLSGIEQLLGRLVDKQSASQSGTIQASNGSSEPPKFLNPSSQSDRTSHGEHFEGESSLTASSKQAHRTLEGLLGQNANVRNDPDVAAALSALQDMQRQGSSGRNNSRLSHPKPLVGRDSKPQPPPPYSAAMDVLQEVKDSGTNGVLAWFWFLAFDINDISKACKKYYAAPDEASTALQIIVYSDLYSMFSGHPLLIEHPQDKTDAMGVPYRMHAERCRTNLDRCLLSLPLNMPPTLENITALALGSAHAMQSAQFSLCWTLTCTAARLCQSLGWHRRNVINQEGSEHAEVKKGLFWTIYFNDKCLSLRLGISSTFQDYDVALEFPKTPADPRYHSWGSFMHLCLEVATLHGLVYEKLYSPGASTSTSDQRISAIQSLTQQIQVASIKNAKILQTPEFQPSYMKMLGESTEVLCACLLTLVYRKMPSTSTTGAPAIANNSHDSTMPALLNISCINAARSAMQAHQRAIRTLQVASKELWLEYFNWTVLNCPFTPFMVVFSNCVNTLSTDDLQLLEDFVSSIRGPAHGSSEAIIRFHTLCDGFYRLAKSYIVASLREKDRLAQQLEQYSVMGTTVPKKRTATDMLQEEGPGGRYTPLVAATGLLAHQQPEHHQQQQQQQHVADPLLYDPQENWLLSGSFEDWLLGAAPSQIDFMGGDWPAYGTL